VQGWSTSDNQNIGNFIVETGYFESSPSCIGRRVHLHSGKVFETQVPFIDGCEDDLESKFDYSYLRLKVPPVNGFGDPIRVADLFCGCGGLSLGAMEACRTIGKRFLPVLALDQNSDAIKVYNRNFKPEIALTQDINQIIDGAIGTDPTESEKILKRTIGEIDILLAGPPCQGHSSLNNYSRKKDKRNALYERVARFVEIIRPKHVLIENVPTVIHCEEKVVQKTVTLLQNLNYSVDNQVVDSSNIGVAQKRKRHLLIASAFKRASIPNVFDTNRVAKIRAVEWAIGDIANEKPTNPFNTPTASSMDNFLRIIYLHAKNIPDLPDFMRPECHRIKKHGYKSMYGRMRLNEPSQTITTGFMSPGQGRFVHPTKCRTITPHEAARLQFFPDFFDFSQIYTRQSLAKLIGNAAPMKLSYVFCTSFLC
jgi:DNA (cytosine-5)-methyltransferase 1